MSQSETHSRDINSVNQGYDILLRDYQLGFREGAYFLDVGTPAKTQGWIVNISIVPYQFRELLGLVVPLLQHFKIPFKIIKDRWLHQAFNNGQYGQEMIGRNVLILLDELAITEELVPLLAEITKGFSGPKVTYDFKIGEHLYARYGGFEPNLREDALGNLDKVVMNGGGKWCREKYVVPPKVPDGIENPFLKFIQAASQDGFENPLLGRYELGRTLAYDVWGAVYEGTVLEERSPKVSCLIFRGKRGMLLDDMKRDIVDRYAWMARVLEALGSDFGMPKVIAHWVDVNYVFIVLSAVNGTSFQLMASKMLNKQPWQCLSADNKQVLTGCWLDLADILARLHQRGYIHRNLHWANVVVDPERQIFLMGWELAYNIITEEPMPCFEGGERGFTSPAQLANKHPVFEDDIYSFGAILVSMGTGLPAYLVIGGEQPVLRSKLLFLTQDALLTDLMVSCLSEEPQKRPDWKAIRAGLMEHQTRLTAPTASCEAEPFTMDDISVILQEAIKGLGSPLMQSDGLWFSPIENKYDRDVYPLGDKHTFFALHRGVGGPLYLLSKALKLGLDVASLESTMQYAFDFLQNHIWNNLIKYAQGLHYGTSGLAVMLGQALTAGLLPVDDYYLDLIERCLRKENRSHDVIYGAAGDGLALLQCADYLSQATFQGLIEPLVNHLLRSQEVTGGWLDKSRSDKPGLVNGFGYGLAGIVYFLLEYGHRYNKYDAKAAAEKGVAYLEQVKIEDINACNWPNSDLDAKQGSWWCHGGPGIALTYLKSYEYTGNKRHLQIAEKALRKHPPKLVYRNLSQCHGMAGLGELYQEAFRVTGSQEWMNRASWIAQLLCTLRFQPTPDTAYWLVENSHFPTADFMIGNSGIIHFLMRYLHPDKVFYPLLPEPLGKGRTNS